MIFASNSATMVKVVSTRRILIAVDVTDTCSTDALILANHNDPVAVAVAVASYDTVNSPRS